MDEKWEYRFVDSFLEMFTRGTGKVLKELSPLGLEGWEAVGFSSDLKGNISILLRLRLKE